jgi:hypothetical protein
MYSTVARPFGFPVKPVKWTVEVTDGAQRRHLTPTQNTWYNIGSLNISVPIGDWKLSHSSYVGVDSGAPGYLSVFSTLSTSNNSESDSSLSYGFITSSQQQQIMGGYREKLISVSIKTPYYLNARTVLTSMTAIEFSNQSVPTIIRAISTLL